MIFTTEKANTALHLTLQDIWQDKTRRALDIPYIVFWITKVLYRVILKGKTKSEMHLFLKA